MRIAFVALAVGRLWFELWEPFSQFSLIGVTATLAGGQPIFKEAFEKCRERRITMELSIPVSRCG